MPVVEVAPNKRNAAAIVIATGISLFIHPGCNRDPVRATPKLPEPLAPLVFREQELPFQYDRGETGSAWPVETTGGGVGLLDFDGDGRLDLFFAQGGPLKPTKEASPLSDVLLRNLGNGQFEDVSERVKLSAKGYGQGVTVADYDADGDPDVYVTRYGRNTLWRNDRESGRVYRRNRRSGGWLRKLEHWGLPLAISIRMAILISSSSIILRSTRPRRHFGTTR